MAIDRNRNKFMLISLETGIRPKRTREERIEQAILTNVTKDGKEQQNLDP